MRVFLAGATGAIGKPLVRALVEAGHEVTGTTRSQAKAADITAAGATPAVCDAFDLTALGGAVGAARPDAVINQLTALPPRFNPRKPDYATTNRLRGEVAPALARMAIEAGAKRLISQSISFIYEPTGSWVKTEEDPVPADLPGSFGEAIRATLELERSTLESGIDGLVLRYGFLYGPGTYYDPAGGSTADEVRSRRFPVVGDGAGVFSFVHVDDAAAATVAALDRGATGIYNITDDEPAPVRDWLPAYAEALGAKPPRRVPRWLARIAAGRLGVGFSTEMRGASNEKAKRELGWQPLYPSWREGFKTALG